MSRPVPKPTPPEQITTSEPVEAQPVVYEFHPLANLFPLLPEDSQEFKDLVADIRANGLRESIRIYQGKILDGRNRYRACEVAGAKVHFLLSPDQEEEERARQFGWPIEPHRAWTDETARDYVLSLNLHRRHLTTDQRAEVLAKLRDQGMSVRAIAEKTKLPKSTVADDLKKVKARQVSETRTPEPKPEDVTRFVRDPLPPPVKPIGGDARDTPKRVTGRDGKSYAASRPTVAEKFEKAVEAAQAKAHGATATGIGPTIVNGLRDLRRASQALKLVDAYGLVGALDKLNETDRQRTAALKVIADLDHRMLKFRMALSETKMVLPQ